ncbi:MAG TPA: ABC transporter permease [Rugosimonospora sp.]|nr:ABC transporter permease [Rugosimonospora sp.]
MNLTIARITARGLLGRRRFALLIPLPLMLVGLTALAHGLRPDRADQWAGPILHGFGFTVLLPLIALIIGTGVLGAEIDDGTIVHILTKPLPRREIVLAKLAVATGITALVSAVPMFVCGVIVDSTRFGLGLALAAVIASAAYCALFLLLSLLTNRPVLIGLVYVLIWEGLLGNLLAGTRALSIQQYALTIAAKTGGTTYLDSHVSVPVSVAMSAAFLVVGTVLAIDRLRSFTLAGETS